MLESLLDNLTTDRIEIDMVEFSGIEFRHVDNRVMSLKLVQLGPERRGHLRAVRRGAAALGTPAQARDAGGARQLPPRHQGQHGHGALAPMIVLPASRK